MYFAPRNSFCNLLKMSDCVTWYRQRERDASICRKFCTGGVKVVRLGTVPYQLTLTRSESIVTVQHNGKQALCSRKSGVFPQIETASFGASALATLRHFYLRKSEVDVGGCIHSMRSSLNCTHVSLRSFRKRATSPTGHCVFSHSAGIT